MLLSALTLAALLQAAPLVEIPATPLVQLPPPRTAKETRGARQLAAWQARTARIAKCRANNLERAKGVPAEPPFSSNILARRSPGMAKRLGELPPAHGERAVLRTVDGCAISTPIVARMDVPQP